MTQRELATRLGRPAQVISEIINAKKAITPETALGLETALGISAAFWINLEAEYELTLARQQEQQRLRSNFALLKQYPVADMMRLGWIEPANDRLSKLDALAKFFGVALPKPDAYQEAVGFRMTEAAREKVSLGALSAWLRQGEIVAEQVATEDFDTSRFEKALSPIRLMTEQDPQDYFPQMQSLCAEAGVALCVVPELPKSGANGVTRWLNDGKAVIQMSIRGKRSDIFWFTFFHEACHVLRHRKQRLIILDGIDSDGENAGIEDEANQFAADFLVDQEQWGTFTSIADFNSATVSGFAQSVGVAPGIIVGRLQSERLIGFNELNHLRISYEWGED